MSDTKKEPTKEFHLNDELCIRGTWHPAGATVQLTEAEAVEYGLLPTPEQPTDQPRRKNEAKTEKTEE